MPHIALSKLSCSINRRWNDLAFTPHFLRACSNAGRSKETWPHAPWITERIHHVSVDKKGNGFGVILVTCGHVCSTKDNAPSNQTHREVQMDPEAVQLHQMMLAVFFQKKTGPVPPTKHMNSARLQNICCTKTNRIASQNMEKNPFQLNVSRLPIMAKRRVM